MLAFQRSSLSHYYAEGKLGELGTVLRTLPSFGLIPPRTRSNFRMVSFFLRVSGQAFWPDETRLIIGLSRRVRLCLRCGRRVQEDYRSSTHMHLPLGSWEQKA